MPSIVQIVQGIAPVTIAPQQAGTCLIAVAVVNDAGTDISSNIDDKSNRWWNLNGGHSVISNTQVNINWQGPSNVPVSPGVYTHPPTTGVTVVSEGGIPGGPVYLWVFEIASPPNTTDPIAGPCHSITPQDEGILAAFGPIPSSANPSLDDTGTACALWFGGANGCLDWDLAIAVCAAGGEGGNITGVQSPWTIAGTPQAGAVCAYQFIPTGNKPCPMVFDAAAPTVSAIAVAGFYSNAPATTGNIVIKKVTSPSGAAQSFTFTPSYGAPFALDDGQSNDSGPLAPGTYSVTEAPVAGWATEVSQDPSAIVLGAGQTITVTFQNTLIPIPPPPIPPPSCLEGRPLLDGDGQLRAPQVMLRWSDDGGKTWSNTYLLNCGKQGQYNARARKTQLGRARKRVWEVSGVDAIPWRLAAAYIEATPSTAVKG